MVVEHCWESADLSMRKNATQGVRLLLSISVGRKVEWKEQPIALSS
jgi:hypothetical protein